DGDDIVGDIGRQLRCGLSLPHLGQHQVGIWIGLYVVVHDEVHQAVGGRVQRIHVVHVVHAAHLLLDGRRYGLFDGLCVRPYVGCEDLNLGWNDVGELGHGKRGDSNGSYDHHDDRDDHGHNWAVDEKLGHGQSPFACSGLILTVAPL